MSDHRARYKNTGLDAKELRRRREENSIQLRKQKRDDVLSKRRTLGAPTNDMDEDLDDLNRSSSPELGLTRDMIEGIMQDQDQHILIESAQKIRRLLSREPQPPFDEVIQNNLVPRLVQLLQISEDPLVQFEVAWILTNICSGTTEQTRVVVNSGALPELVRLMRSPDIRVCEQAVWALGNIIGDNGQFRDAVISHNFVNALLDLINSGLELGFLRNATWVLVNLCRNKEPPTDSEVIKQILPALMSLIGSDDQTILIDTTWAISYITELGPTYSQLVIDYGLVKKMTRLISHEESKIKTAAIRALGCIATGSDEQTQAVVDAGAIPALRNAFEGLNDRIAKEALWFLSNVVAGSQEQIQAVIDADLVPMIIHFLSNGDYQQQKEASWAVFNFCLTGSQDQLKVLIENGAVPALCDLLTLNDNTLIKNVLEALKSLLRKCDDNTVRNQIEACGGLDRIEALQDSPNQEIYQYSYVIIENYFSENDQ
uniref:Importin subunit alpha n=1 Tax=Aceria tosichella TaxID=561515 RepID=A0A6G1S6S5_9ACAR